jgi:hypothetical protein
MPCAYREDTDKKDQGHAILDKGFTPPVLDEHGLAIMAAITLAASEDGDTYKTTNKGAIPVTASATLIPYRSEDTNVRSDYDSRLDDGPVLVRGRFGRRTIMEIPFFLVFILLLIVTSQGFGLRGIFLPLLPHHRLGGTTVLSPLPPYPHPLTMDNVWPTASPHPQVR